MRTLILIFLSLFLTLIAKSQNIDSALIKFHSINTYEKVYVHFDNTKYTPGQTIWYKAYLMNGFQPSLLSKNLYIDWYDDNGNLLNSTVTPIITSFSNGNFKVPENYKGSNIHAVAYTKWMRNFDSVYFFNQNLQIVSNIVAKANKDIVVTESSIQLLPESGSLIANKINVLAFKAINGLGLPENVSGLIRNLKGDSIASFKSLHDGMGKVQFIPVNSQQYIAVWKDVLGILHKTPLPQVEDHGVNLTIDPGRSNRIFHVQRTRDAPVNMQLLTLVGQMNGSILFMAKLNLSDKESVTSTLPISKMLSGILQLTIFDMNEKPLCERVIFVKNEDYKINVSATIDTLSIVKRGKNVLEIDLKDSTYANLSLSITDAYTNKLSEHNIISHLLLNSDLVGNVYKPAYYFSADVDSISNHLDLVMLTNGWRKYNWSNILKGQSPNFTYSKDTSYQAISGKVLEYANRKSKKSESINLIFVAKDSSNNMITLPILEDGSFVITNAMLYDTTKIYFKINGSTTATNKNISFNNDFYKVDTNAILNYTKDYNDTIGLAKLQYIVNEQARLDSINKLTSLKEVTVFSKQRARIKELDKKYTFGVFSGEAAAAFDMSTIQNSSHTIDVYDFLDGKVPGLEFTNTEGGTLARKAEFRRGKASFYLNENYINESEVANIDMGMVAYIKIFSPPGISGPNGSGGAIAIYTKKGNYLTSKDFVANGLDYKLYPGYVGYKEFYSPNYAEKGVDKLLENSNDLRSTLLWNPWIVLDERNPKIKIIFYNNDITNAFRLVLEGMDSKGKLVSINKVIK
jgi:hypothetical protein